MLKGGKNSKNVFALFLFLSIYPIVRSFYEMIGSDSRKIAESIIGINYYLMIFLGYSISLKTYFINLFNVIYILMIEPINCIKDLMKIIHELPVYYCFSNYF